MSPIFGNDDLNGLQLDDSCVLKVHGVYWTEKQFVELAATFRHPLEPQFAMPDVLVNEVDFQTNAADVEVARDRALFFKQWTKRAVELNNDEQELKAQHGFLGCKSCGIEAFASLP